MKGAALLVAYGVLMKVEKGTIIKFYNECTGSEEVERSYTKIPNSVIFDNSVSTGAKDLYSFLLALSWRLQNRQTVNGGIIVSQDYLSLKRNVTRRTILNRISELENKGYLKRRKLGNELTEITVIIKKSASDEWEEMLVEMLKELQG